jgi:hypothetical protein
MVRRRRFGQIVCMRLSNGHEVLQCSREYDERWRSKRPQSHRFDRPNIAEPPQTITGRFLKDNLDSKYRANFPTFQFSFWLHQSESTLGNVFRDEVRKEQKKAREDDDNGRTQKPSSLVDGWPNSSQRHSLVRGPNP